MVSFLTDDFDPNLRTTKKNFNNAGVILPCGLRLNSRFDCCANSCRDKAKIEDWRRDPTNPLNPIEQCYSSRSKERAEAAKKKQFSVTAKLSGTDGTREEEDGAPLTPRQEDASENSETANPTG